MKTVLLASLLLATSCGAFVAPSPAPVDSAPMAESAPCEPSAPPVEAYVPQHDGISATTDDGAIVYLCATQLRPYVALDGTKTEEEDHYISATPCPSRPID